MLSARPALGFFLALWSCTLQPMTCGFRTEDEAKIGHMGQDESPPGSEPQVKSSTFPLTRPTVWGPDKPVLGLPTIFDPQPHGFMTLS